jgi:hypothetical protein
MVEDLFNSKPGVSDQSLWEWANLKGEPADIVTLSFGGNDVGFDDVIRDCLPISDNWREAITGGVLGGVTGGIVGDIGQGCDTRDEDLLARFHALTYADPEDGCRGGRDPSRRSRQRPDEGFECSLLIEGAPDQEGQTRGNLVTFYRKIVDEHLTDRGHLLVLGYPSLVAPLDEWPGIIKIACEGITQGDATRMAARNRDLNKAISDAVDLVNFQLSRERVHFIDLYALYRNNKADLCGTNEDWLNGFTVTRGRNLRYFYSGSFHPNGLGHRATADLVEGTIRSIDWTGIPATSGAFASTTNLAIDTSGSMEEPAGDGTGTKMASAVRAAADIFTLVEAQRGEDPQQQAQHRVGVVAFDTDARTVQSPTGELQIARASLDGLWPNGQTNIGAGLGLALDQLEGSGGHRAIVLLSDGVTNVGLSPSEIRATVITRANAAGVTIHTVGFGHQAAGTIDEPLLRDIAHGTGGEYSFESTRIGLQRAFLTARAASLGDVHVTEEGAVGQGETVAAESFTIPERRGELEVALAWPGSDLDIILTDPRGRQVDDRYPGARIVRTNPEVVIVSEPRKGEWQLAIAGIEVPGDVEDFAVVASSRGEAPPRRPEALPLVLGGMLLLLGVGIPGVLLTRRGARQRVVLEPAQSVLHLRVVGGVEDQRILPIVPGEVIGRSEEAHHVLLDESVSRQHAQIGVQDGEWFILDLGSSAGTLRNAEPVLQARLQPGDIVTLGQTVLQVEGIPIWAEEERS